MQLNISFKVLNLSFREYLQNIKLVDAGIQKVVGLIENFYANDRKTTYVMTSDHGMTNWGLWITFVGSVCVQERLCFGERECVVSVFICSQ